MLHTLLIYVGDQRVMTLYGRPPECGRLVEVDGWLLDVSHLTHDEGHPRTWRVHCTYAGPSGSTYGDALPAHNDGR